MAKAGETDAVLSSATAVSRADISATTLQQVLSETNFDVKSVKTLKLWEMAEAKNAGRIFLSKKLRKVSLPLDYC